MIEEGPFSQADGAQTIYLRDEAHLLWHEVAISFEDDTGAPLDPAAGSMAGAALGAGADKPEPFSEVLDITSPSNDRRWKPFFSRIDAITITPTALAANVRYRVTIINSVGV